MVCTYNCGQRESCPGDVVTTKHILQRLAHCQRIDTLLDIHARERPDQIALLTGELAISYADLHRRVQRVASQLQAAGLKPGDRIALLARNDPAFCELMMAASRLGVVLVPVNFRLAGPEVEFILKDSGAKILFVGADLRSLAAGVSATCDGVRRVVEISVDGSYSGWVTGQQLTAEAVTGAVDPILFQMYTSGTTGRPKGALISQNNVLAVMRNGCTRLGQFDEDSISLLCMPLFHIAGSSWLFFGLAAGCQNIVVVDLVPDAILKMIEQHKVTCTLLVPTAIHMVTTSAENHSKTIRSLRTLVFGASPMPTDLLRRARQVFPETDFIHVYGMTETTGMFTSLPPEELRAGRRLESCGRVFDDAAARIVDTQGMDVSAGVVGEIICKTPQLMTEYWNRPEATAGAIKDGWYYTGDAGSLDAEGFLYIRDRIRDLVITGGENVYPAEVEDALLAHPSVAEAAVIGVPDQKWGEVVLAAIVPSPSTQVDDEELRNFVRERLAGFKVPRRIEIVDSLPRNAAGKVTKDDLRAQFISQN